MAKHFITSLTILIVTLLAAPNMLAADRVVTGVVVSSEDSEPLIGASVAVSQSQLKEANSSLKTLGVVTDLDGKFSITIPDAVKQLEIRYVGYNPRTIELVPGLDNYDLQLDRASEVLSDVVVTGYQNIEKRKLTASITKVELDDSKLGSIMTVDQALAGQVAGLSAIQSSGSPGAPMKIRIRGTASLNGTQDPLWVIDGIPVNGTEVPTLEELNDIDNLYQSSIAGLNPADIESITVLKDAAATAIYGTRAANGVIVVTTKKGRSGAPEINFSTRLTYSPRPDIDRLNLLSSDEKSTWSCRCSTRTTPIARTRARWHAYSPTPDSPTSTRPADGARSPHRCSRRSTPCAPSTPTGTTYCFATPSIRSITSASRAATTVPPTTPRSAIRRRTAT